MNNKYIIIFILTLFACKKVELRDFKPVEKEVYVTSPCNTRISKNSVTSYTFRFRDVFNKVNLSNSEYLNGYKLIMTNPNYERIELDFLNKPLVSGKYDIHFKNLLYAIPTACSFTYVNYNYDKYIPTGFEYIYVNILDNGLISISFCEINLKNSSNDEFKIHFGDITYENYK